jgi:hypothetical protein
MQVTHCGSSYYNDSRKKIAGMKTQKGIKGLRSHREMENRCKILISTPLRTGPLGRILKGSLEK